MAAPEDARTARGPGRALDEARFGAVGMLDLHPLRPTAGQAARRVQAWVRERQVMGLREVCVITGRGAHSDGGVSPVREAVQQTLGRLRREGVVDAVSTHTEGSFVVTLAPIARRLDAPARHRDPQPPPPPPLLTLEGLSNDTLELLEAVAVQRLEHLGVGVPTSGQVVSEMGHVFSRLVGSHGASETALQSALRRASDELDFD